MNPLFSCKQILTSSETAQILGISVTSVRNWVRHGFISSVSPDSEYRFLLDDVISLQAKIESGELRRLGSRANKIKSSRTFIPGELFKKDEDRKKIARVSAMITESGIDASSAMFALSVSLLAKKNMLGGASAESFIMSETPTVRGRRNLTAILRSWKKKLLSGISGEVLCDIIQEDIPELSNITGIVYQSILAEGEKSKLGSYYTPDRIAAEIAERMYAGGPLFLDPCCGTGQFLLAFAEKYGTAENVWGIDIDPVAVNLAKINLMLLYPEYDFEPKIFCNDSLMNYNERLLFDDISSLPEFDIIATNPPWGSHYKKAEQAKLLYYYPEITSGESYSCFLVKSMRMLRPEGSLCFVLPESVMNVKMHSDIRRFMISSCSISRIEYCDRMFKNVFSPAVILDINKKKDDALISIIYRGESYTTTRERFLKNRDLIFDINLSPSDERIIRKIYSTNHITLSGKASWALGIVTGNNEGFLRETCDEFYEPVIKGKDIEPFRIMEPDSFIRFEPEKFQQSAPEHLYRTGEKLIYKYISNRLTFARDCSGRLTLNSANILVPEIPGISMKYLMGLFNSRIYQFIFRKKFNSVKVLRSHIEELPVPVISENEMNNFILLVDHIENGEPCACLDQLVYSMFDLDDNDIEQVENYLI